LNRLTRSVLQSKIVHPALRDWMRDRIHRNLLYRAAREGALVLGWRRPPLVYDRKSFRQLEQFRIRIGQSQIRHRNRLRSDSWVRPLRQQIETQLRGIPEFTVDCHWPVIAELARIVVSRVARAFRFDAGDQLLSQIDTNDVA
jgi:hypothetical protein